MDLFQNLTGSIILEDNKKKIIHNGNKEVMIRVIERASGLRFVYDFRNGGYKCHLEYKGNTIPCVEMVIKMTKEEFENYSFYSSYYWTTSIPIHIYAISSNYTTLNGKDSYSGKVYLTNREIYYINDNMIHSLLVKETLVIMCCVVILDKVGAL